MRLLLRVTILSLVLIGLIVSLWNMSRNSVEIPAPRKPKDSEYEINLLNKINDEIIENQNKSPTFIRQTMKLFDSSPKLCDITYLYSIPICTEFTDKSLISSMKYNQMLEFAENTSINFGGYWAPKQCNSDQTIAIIIPFRDRWRQVMELLPVLHQILQIQNNCYRIFLIEQFGSETFNKGRLNNAGFLLAITMFYFNCVIFHDTDLIPETSKIPYKCSDVQPTHLASAVDVHNYHLPYSTLIGGVLAFRPYHYASINGFSNYYWGWGLEDDDMELRLRNTVGYNRVPETVGRYRTIKHNPQYKFPIQQFRRQTLLSTATKRMLVDGLSSLTYNTVRTSNRPLYTHIIVDIGNQPIEFF